ncbi:hypothetical protein DN412_39365 [Cupriavidus lacunae]|uniref:Uncharacterized protein n=1 Tax=Cupriavidus lacunae TaxID=2666307 RepID=A0A370NHH6_9BURK|nr:hypothetical protein DN412_39365 [Cupriavidus lacunae]
MLVASRRVDPINRNIEALDRHSLMLVQIVLDSVSTIDSVVGGDHVVDGEVGGVIEVLALQAERQANGVQCSARLIENERALNVSLDRLFVNVLWVALVHVA